MHGWRGDRAHARVQSIISSRSRRAEIVRAKGYQRDAKQGSPIVEMTALEHDELRPK